MRNPRGVVAGLLALALVVAACGDETGPTSPPSATPPPTPAPTPAITEIPFAPAAFPADGSACDLDGYEGRLGRVETVDARTVRFTLCAPDAAFVARLAHPVANVLDAASIAALERSPADRDSLAGTGRYRLASGTSGENILLQRAGAEATPDAVSPVIVVAWNADAAARTRALEEATVDGIDAPGAAELDEIATLPELVVTDRAGLATAFLAFGSGPAFAGAEVRRAIAGALDRGAVVNAAFPAGSTVPSHVTPCGVDNACGGPGWYEFNAPAAAASLAAAGFDLRRTYPLHVPDRPVPGLPDPAAAAAAIKEQLETNIGLKVSIDVMPADELRAAADKASLNSLYLDGVVSPVADPSGFLEPLFGDGVRTTPARRATGVSRALEQAAAEPDAAARKRSITEANTAIRDSAVIVPLAHPGSTVTFRSDVSGVVTSPLGVDPLGAVTPGDRPQLVFAQAAEPAGAWCGDQSTIDAFRVCGLLAEGLYGVDDGGLTPEPALASGCEPNDDATVWTCTLRSGVTFDDGARLDAGDVLASVVAAWDGEGPLRRAARGDAFVTWDALFGGPVPAGG
ncbi:MAG TPA: ABC transporter substrate-binding protein [Candidatus Limnocylindrales bacterium]|nr:ABC transporter substrate-binding protein [Candidatus Limnocylindrales bacterium]